MTLFTDRPYCLAQGSEGPLPWIALALAVVALVLAWFWFRSMKRKRLIENVPTSKVKGVALGLTEVKGIARKRDPIRSYLAERLTVWFHYTIDEHWSRTVTETYTDSKGRTRTRTRTESGWKTVQSNGAMGRFFLEDDTGRIRVDPGRAEVEGRVVFQETCRRSDPLYYGKGPPGRVSDSTGKRRFIERAVVVGDRLYVMGSARLRSDAVAAEIAYDAEDPMYLISTRDEAAIVSGYGRWAIAQAVLGTLLSTGGTAGLVAAARHVEFKDPAALVPGLLAGLGYVLLLCGLYALLMYNGLVLVRTRIGKAWSLIEVQLQRRADLVPRLAAVVKAYGDYERDAQAGFTELRSDALSGRSRALHHGAVHAAERVADGQTELLGKVLGVVEDHPELKADGLYLKLQHELADTEERIALARRFYNDTVKAYNERIATLPDALFARLMALGRVSYYEIEAFERRPVTVDLMSPDDESDEPVVAVAV